MASTKDKKSPTGWCLLPCASGPVRVLSFSLAFFISRSLCIRSIKLLRTVGETTTSLQLVLVGTAVQQKFPHVHVTDFVERNLWGNQGPQRGEFATVRYSCSELLGRRLKITEMGASLGTGMGVWK